MPQSAERHSASAHPDKEIIANKKRIVKIFKDQQDQQLRGRVYSGNREQRDNREL
jgi:hypothetical protein